MLPTTLTMCLPPWVNDVDLPDPPAHLSDRMEFVLALAMRNVDQGTGGPFAAAVFEQESGRLVAGASTGWCPRTAAWPTPRCSPSGWPRRPLGTYDLGGSGHAATPNCQQRQMCATCLGAVVWSGVGEVVYSTTAGDVIATVGFDEGPTPPDYSHQLAHRGISVVAGIMRDEGLTVPRRYVQPAASSTTPTTERPPRAVAPCLPRRGEPRLVRHVRPRQATGARRSAADLRTRAAAVRSRCRGPSGRGRG